MRKPKQTTPEDELDTLEFKTSGGDENDDDEEEFELGAIATSAERDPIFARKRKLQVLIGVLCAVGIIVLAAIFFLIAIIIIVSRQSHNPTPKPTPTPSASEPVVPPPTPLPSTLPPNRIDLSESIAEFQSKMQSYPTTLHGGAFLWGNESGTLWMANEGYHVNPDTTPGTTWPKFSVSESMLDLASVTKVTATYTAYGILYQRGYTQLEDKVVDTFPEFAAGPSAAQKATLTWYQMLSHKAGFPEYPTVQYHHPAFGCPGAEEGKVQTQNFNCSTKIYKAVMEQELVQQPSSGYLYSNFGCIMAAYFIGWTAKQNQLVTYKDLRKECLPIANWTEPNDPNGRQGLMCWYEAFVRKYIIDVVGMKNTMFLPPKGSNCVPSLHDKNYRNKIIQCEVGEGNSFAMGGISGHAGLFSTATDLGKFLHTLVFTEKLWNSTTLSKFTTDTGDLVGVGWVVMPGWCSTMSFPTTFQHMGDTGSQLCVDKARKIYLVWLANNSFPGGEAQWYSNVLQVQQPVIGSMVSKWDSDYAK